MRLRHQSLALWVLGAAWGCATRPPPPRGDELEREATPARSAVHGSVGTAPVKSTEPDELAAAFTPEKREVGPIDHNVPVAPEQEEEAPMTAARQRFVDALTAARPRLGSTRKGEVLEAIQEMGPWADAAGPESQQQWLEVEVHARKALKDVAGATRAADRWLKSCGPLHVDACRHKALAYLPGSGVPRHDACLAQAEGARPPRLPGCFASSVVFYEKERDALMVQRALLDRALAMGPKATLEAFGEAERACTQLRCTEQRRRVFREGAEWALSNEDLRGAAAMAFGEMRVAAEVRPPAEQAFARTALVDRVCAALDAKESPGVCRKLEKEQLGRYFFQDFSRTQLKEEGLPPHEVKRVGDHFAVLLQECLAAEADRMAAPAAERYEIHWLVLNDGRVDQVHMGRKEQDAGPLAQCLRAQFAYWRYPRYRGEWQHVDQGFIVTARERRLMPTIPR